VKITQQGGLKMNNEQVLKMDDRDSNSGQENYDSRETHENVQRAVEALRSLISYVERSEY
jgi:hypothetical protein